MSKFLFLVGFLQLAFSVMVLASAVGAMHEVFASSLFGFGALCIGLASLLDRHDKQLHLLGRILAEKEGRPAVQYAQPAPSQSAGSSVQTSTAPARVPADGDVVQTYLGMTIRKAAGGKFSVNGRLFDSIAEAERFIDTIF